MAIVRKITLDLNEQVRDHVRTLANTDEAGRVLHKQNPSRSSCALGRCA
jgi:hypothetical protein